MWLSRPGCADGEPTIMNTNLAQTRLIGFDVGRARVGVARTTALETAEELGVLHVKNRPWAQVLDEARPWVEEFEIEGFVVGQPRNMDGTLGEQAQFTKGFARALRRAFPGMPVDMEDERLSTEEARVRLTAMGVKGSKAAERIDATAACVILESRLARLKLEERGKEQKRSTE